MIEFLKFLHVAPLFVIMILLLLPIIFRVFKKNEISSDILSSSLLLLSSIGIASGANVHDHDGGMLFIDPCFGYAAVLVFVAVKLISKFAKKKIA